MPAAPYGGRSRPARYASPMVEPTDFGLSPAATLAHVGDPARSCRHTSFWKAWTTAVLAESPRLVERREADPSDPSATHEFESCRHVRIGCGLAMPSGSVQGGVVALHGYGDVPTLGQSLIDWQSLVDRGVAVLAVRVRGYPGSRLDAPHLTQASAERGGGAWITTGLTEPISDRGYGCEWAFSYAAADVVNAVRALREFLCGMPVARHGHVLAPNPEDMPAQSSRHATPIFLHGESFGGALAVIAASVLAEQNEVARLAIGVPGMGDWAWRLSGPPDDRRCGIGSGRLIRASIEDNPRVATEIYQTLRVLDSAILARRVRCPVLCKLALRDEMVPAPAAAAVFNALGSDPGCKWRHVTRYGHFDGGIADLRRHAAFEKRVVDFLDPALDPGETLAEGDSVLAGAPGLVGARAS